jgi:Domain of unknown function (DUF6457)
MSNPLEAWLVRLADALGVDASVVDVNLVLDLARDAAHGVARPAAPLTTFLVGFAAGVRGGGPDDIAAATRTARRLAAETG